MSDTPSYHTIDCIDRLRGFAARHLPSQATFSLRNLADAGNALRRTGHDPACECGRLALARLDSEIETARRRGDTAAVTQLRVFRRETVMEIEAEQGRRARAATALSDKDEATS